MVVTCAPSSSRERDAAARHRAPVDDHRARAAVAAVAAIFRAGEVGRVAKRPQQGRRRIEPVFHRLAVHRHPRHAATLAWRVPPCQDEAMPRITTSNGSAIGYEEAGGGGATPIVFLHGVGSDKSVWRPQLDHFGARAPRRRLRLSGLWRQRSRARRHDPRRLCLGDPVRDGRARHRARARLRPLARRSRRDRDAPCRAGRCASLILADSFAVHPEGRAIYDRSIAASGDLRAMAEARVDVLLAQPADPQSAARSSRRWREIDPAAYRIGAEAVWLADQRDRAARIDVPTLVLCGSEDKVTPPSLSRRADAAHPRRANAADSRRRPHRQSRKAGRVQSRGRAFIRGAE